MAAISVDNLLVLPRLHAVDPTVNQSRGIRSITVAPKGFEGEGFPVRRAFQGVPTAVLDPFIHMDQMGEIDYAPGEPKGTPWHPHRGFETVTYIIDGIFVHHDSTGGGGVIKDGSTQWMTAGSGILHIETPPEDLVIKGGLFHGIQLWVNLPKASKWVAPKYQNLESSSVGLMSSADGSSLIRVIAGSIDGVEGPGTTTTPINLLHITLSPGAEVRINWPRNYNALVYALSGQGFLGAEKAAFKSGQLGVLQFGDFLEIANSVTRTSETLEVLLMGGQPIGEPVAWQGPFVMNTRSELEQAFDDFQKGKMGRIPPTYKFQ